jgi:hypothetical protein
MWKSLNLQLSAPTDFALSEVFFYLFLSVQSAEISRWNHYFKCENVLYVTCLQRDEEQEREEMEEGARLRKEAVHKAHPIRRYKPISLMSSDKLLTDPLSPSFMSRQRANSK